MNLCLLDLSASPQVKSKSYLTYLIHVLTATDETSQVWAVLKLFWTYKIYKILIFFRYPYFLSSNCGQVLLKNDYITQQFQCATFLKAQKPIYRHSCRAPKGEIFYYCGLDSYSTLVLRACQVGECVSDHYCTAQGTSKFPA